MAILSRIIGKIINKVIASDTDPKREQQMNIVDRLNNNEVCGVKAHSVKISTLTADLWRIAMAEQLGRDLCATPMPYSVNGSIVVYDESMETGAVQFISKHDGQWSEKINEV